MTSRKKDSPAIELLRLVWRSSAHRSWERLNGTMGRALKLAIEAEMRFEPEDWKVIDDNFRPEYWRHTEHLYAVAVAVGNISAARAIEQHLGRGPFRCDTIIAMPRVLSGRQMGAKKARLAAGTEFLWKGERVWVTSFGDGEHVTACSYKTAAGPWGGDRRVLHRHRITVADLRADRAARKARRAAWQAILAANRARPEPAAAGAVNAVIDDARQGLAPGVDGDHLTAAQWKVLGDLVCERLAAKLEREQ